MFDPSGHTDYGLVARFMPCATHVCTLAGPSGESTGTNELGLASIADFVSVVAATQYEAELKTLVNPCAAAKDSAVQISRLRQAWLAASRADERLQRESQQGNEDIESPLNKTQTQDLEREWEQRYHVTVELRLTGAYSLISRLFREFRRMTPSLLAIRKIRSMLTTLEPRATRKVSVGDDVNLEINATNEESVATLIDYYWGLRILAGVSAFSGNYTVDSKITAGTKVMFARLDVNLNLQIQPSQNNEAGRGRAKQAAVLIRPANGGAKILAAQVGKPA